MLSSTHEVGHGVAVVIDIQCRYLVARGHELFVGGPRGEHEFEYEGCHRVYIESPGDAALFAAENGIDCIVAHTPPFFSAFRWMGSQQKTIAYDYGEPPADLFPDSIQRRLIEAEKKFCLAMAGRRYAISESVREEAAIPDMNVIRIANSHLAVWAHRIHDVRRSDVRRELNLKDRIVVINVCRFHSAERHYKGIDAYIAARDRFILLHPDLSDRVAFTLCGRGSEHDVAEMEAHGLVVFPNVTDDELVDLYCAADIYANFSMWEGYNLGIGQALSMGLPVIASDIPAHREFGVFTSNDTDAICQELRRLITLVSATPTYHRQPTVWNWEEPLSRFAAAIDELVYEH
jgi:glycosyltransferase involved in cell wall biosynthesis